MTKFETHQAEVRMNFQGPFRLDRYLVEAIVAALPGVYIFTEMSNIGIAAYVGSSINLSSRLEHWARKANGNSMFYFQYCAAEKIKLIEGRWILKIGDLNNRSEFYFQNPWRNWQ